MAMEKIPIDKLQPGMILGQDIDDDNGRTIIPIGARLTPMYIKRLGKWGITEVAIEEEAEVKQKEKVAAGEAMLREASTEDKEFMRRVAAEVQGRFSKCEDNALMQELRRLAIRHLVLNGRGAFPGMN